MRGAIIITAKKKPEWNTTIFLQREGKAFEEGEVKIKWVRNEMESGRATWTRHSRSGECFLPEWIVGICYLSIQKHKYPHKDEQD